MYRCTSSWPRRWMDGAVVSWGRAPGIHWIRGCMGPEVDFYAVATRTPQLQQLWTSRLTNSRRHLSRRLQQPRLLACDASAGFVGPCLSSGGLCGICGGQSGSGTGFLGAPRFPCTDCSELTTTASRCWFNRPVAAVVPSGPSLTARSGPRRLGVRPSFAEGVEAVNSYISKGVSHTPTARSSGTHFCCRLSRPQSHSVPGRIRPIEESNQLHFVPTLPHTGVILRLPFPSRRRCHPKITWPSVLARKLLIVCFPSFPCAFVVRLELLATQSRESRAPRLRNADKLRPCKLTDVSEQPAASISTTGQPTLSTTSLHRRFGATHVLHLHRA
jgi:hypothetical protein